MQQMNIAHLRSCVCRPSECLTTGRYNAWAGGLGAICLLCLLDHHVFNDTEVYYNIMFQC